MSLLGKIGWPRRPLLVAAAAAGLLATAGLTAPAKAQWYYPAYAGYCNPWYSPYGCGYAYEPVRVMVLIDIDKRRRSVGQREPASFSRL